MKTAKRALQRLWRGFARAWERAAEMQRRIDQQKQKNKPSGWRY